MNNQAHHNKKEKTMQPTIVIMNFIYAIGGGVITLVFHVLRLQVARFFDSIRYWRGTEKRQPRSGPGSRQYFHWYWSSNWTGYRTGAELRMRKTAS